MFFIRHILMPAGPLFPHFPKKMRHVELPAVYLKLFSNKIFIFLLFELDSAKKIGNINTWLAHIRLIYYSEKCWKY